MNDFPLPSCLIRNWSLNHHNRIKNTERINNFIIFPFFSSFLFFFIQVPMTKKKVWWLYLDERPGKTVEALNSMPQQVVGCIIPTTTEQSICFFICFLQSCVLFRFYYWCKGGHSKQHVKFVRICEGKAIEDTRRKNITCCIPFGYYQRKNMGKKISYTQKWMATCGCFGFSIMIYFIYFFCNSMCKQIAVFTIAKYLYFSCWLT